MGLHSFVLLVSALLLCFIGAPAQGVSSVYQEGPPHQRWLRVDEAPGNTNGERTFEKTASLFKKARTEVDNLVDATKLKKARSQWNKLKLDGDLVTSLKSPQVAKYYRFNLSRDPAKRVPLIGKFTKMYGEDIVANTLVSLEKKATATGDTEFLALVKQLREDQVADLLARDLTGLRVVKALKMGDDESIFGSTSLVVLEDYIAKRGGRESLLKTLTTIYRDESNLVKMISRASSHPFDDAVAMEKAKSVENLLISKWTSEKLSPESVFDRLKFGDKLGYDLVYGKVRVLYKYSPSSTLEQLNRKFGEAEVARALVRAKPGQYARNEATQLLKQQMDVFLSKDYTPGQIFGILKLKEGRAFRSEFETLDEYIKMFNTKHPQDATDILTVMKKGLGGGDFLSKSNAYSNLVFMDWMLRGLDPNSVAVKVFKMSEADVAAKKYSEEVKPIIKEFTNYFKEDEEIMGFAARNGRS